MVAPRFGIDTRALAAFRIGLGLALLVDLLLRARNLRLFYTNDGVLPVSLLAERAPTLARWSLHARSGEAWFQGLLFAVAIACALALAVGYRTRTATAASLVLLLSLHARNPYVLSGGDSLLQHLLFWSLFLPLGERWAVDPVRRETIRERLVSVAGAAILIQVLLVYGVNAVLKLRSDGWMAGEAVSTVVGLDHLTVFLAPLLREFSTVLWAANWVWVALLLASPLLVVLTGRWRTGLVAAFAVMHVGMVVTMHLGVFPFVSVVALVLFLPAGVWDAFERSPIADELQRWAVRIRATVARGRPGWSPGIRSPTDASKWASFHRWGRRSADLLAVLVITGLLVFNAVALGFVPTPPPADDRIADDDVDVRWDLFAPHPPTTDRWYVAAGDVDSGERIDAFRGANRSGERPGDVAGDYSTVRMRKYLGAVRTDERLRAPFATAFCEEWNRAHDRTLVALTIVDVTAPSHTTGDGSRGRTELVSVSCGPVRE